MKKIEYSVVVPLYNEEEVLEKTYSRIEEVMESMKTGYEVIMVNDGSKDKTAYIAKEICKKNTSFKLITFSRNFGHQTAITAGMDHSSGDAVIVIDADLQDPPEIIRQMAEKWKEGYDVVYGRRILRKGESFFKRASSSLFYRLLNKLSDTDIPSDVGDFRLIDKKVKKALQTVPEHNRYVRGLISWLGFKQTSVDFIREPRAAGKTKYPLRKMMKLGIDGITSFSYKPLKFGAGIGIFLSVFSLVFAVAVILLRVFDIVSMEPGWASLMVVVLFFFGIVLIILGIIGEYIARIFEEVKARPLYVITEKTGKFANSDFEKDSGE